MIFYGLKYCTEQVHVEYSSFILQPNKSSGKQFLIRTERLSVTNLLTLIYGENTTENGNRGPIATGPALFRLDRENRSQ